MSTVLALTEALIARSSVTPEDGGCQRVLAERLQAAGFHTESMRFGAVDNLWARIGSSSPVLCFAGHTDVVPPGPLGEWHFDPFTPTLRDGLLYGRGAADMKASLAAMVVAAERFAARPGAPSGSLALLLTSDEEGPAVDGTARVLDTLTRRGERIDHCVVGEPSSARVLGDTVRVGRRGSLTGTLQVRGTQGHVAYPDRARNPIHALAPALAELTTIEWDRGNAHFPPTGFQVSNLRSGTGATNVIPGLLTAQFNFRHSTELTAEAIVAKLRRILDRHGLDYTIEWRPPCPPYLTEQGTLTDAVQTAVGRVTGRRPELSTSGGTSDGRFLAAAGAQVVEVGPVNATIHKLNECVAVADLEPLAEIYLATAERLLTGRRADPQGGLGPAKSVP